MPTPFFSASQTEISSASNEHRMHWPVSFSRPFNKLSEPSVVSLLASYTAAYNLQTRNGGLQICQLHCPILSFPTSQPIHTFPPTQIIRPPSFVYSTLFFHRKSSLTWVFPSVISKFHVYLFVIFCDTKKLCYTRNAFRCCKQVVWRF